MGDWRDLLPGAAGEFDLEDLLGRVALLEAHITGLTATYRHSDDRLALRALALHRARARRTIEFGDELFGEPAWDMLLDLFVKHVRGEVLRTQSLCIASGVPSTTALRWVQVLEDRELLRRFADEHDRRVTLVELTPKGFSLMRRVLARFVMPASRQ